MGGIQSEAALPWDPTFNRSGIIMMRQVISDYALNLVSVPPRISGLREEQIMVLERFLFIYLMLVQNHLVRVTPVILNLEMRGKGFGWKLGLFYQKS